jgi:hypothetical protein
MVALMKTCALKFRLTTGLFLHFSDAAESWLMDGLAMTMTDAPSTMFASPNFVMRQCAVAHQLLQAHVMTIMSALTATLVSCQTMEISPSAEDLQHLVDHALTSTLAQKTMYASWEIQATSHSVSQALQLLLSHATIIMKERGMTSASHMIMAYSARASTLWTLLPRQSECYCNQELGRWAEIFDPFESGFMVALYHIARGTASESFKGQDFVVLSVESWLYVDLLPLGWAVSECAVWLF